MGANSLRFTLKQLKIHGRKIRTVTMDVLGLAPGYPYPQYLSIYYTTQDFLELPSCLLRYY